MPLTARAFDVLLALVERRGRTVEKDELLRLVWPDTVVEEANLSQQVFTIRKLLGAGLEDAPYIVTVPRRGYRFVAEVHEAAVAPAAASPAAPPAVPSAGVLRLSIPIGSGAPLAAGRAHAIAISPDGRYLVYVAAIEGATQLMMWPLDRFKASPLAGTEGAACPFFSPDGRWVAFQAGARLLKVPASGGPGTVIAELEGGLRGASWSPRDEIVFAPGPASGLWRVSASGMGMAPLTKLRFEARGSARIAGRTCCPTAGAWCSR